MRSVTVFVMLDACRHDYIHPDTTPFLSALAEKGFLAPVKPTFGFEPDGAYLAGLYPDEADGGAQFWYEPETSPFKIARFFPSVLDRLPEFPQKVVRRLLRRHARRGSRAPNLSTARLPFDMLARMSFPVKTSLDHPDFCGIRPTVFDLLRAKERPYLYHVAPDHRVTAKAVLHHAEQSLVPPLGFAFFHMGDLDGAGHAHGPDSPQVVDALKRVDRHLEALYRLSKNRFDEVHFVVMGDHGMVAVKDTVDVQRLLARLPWVSGKDYYCILDSTMARLWFFSRDAETEIETVLDGLEGGRILRKDDTNIYHLNYSHNRFGDLIFLAHEGILISPNHYQDGKPVKGMHGYAPETYGQQAALIIDSPKITPGHRTDSVDMRRVFPTLCNLAGLDIPRDCRVEPLEAL